MQIDPRNIEVISDEDAAMFRRLSPAQRLRTASGMFEFARQLLRASVKQQHPDWDDARVVAEAARRLSRGPD